MPCPGAFFIAASHNSAAMVSDFGHFVQMTKPPWRGDLSHA